MDTPETERALPMDFSRIKETSDGDLEFEQELFTIFLEDCDERMARLEEAVKTGDAETVRREAHTIKGASANVGTTFLHEIASTLEARGTSNSAEEIHALKERLSAEYTRVKAAIKDYLNTD